MTSCTSIKEEDIEIKRHFCMVQLTLNDDLTTRIANEVGKSENPKMIALKKKLADIGVARQKYVLLKSDSALLAYSKFLLSNYRLNDSSLVQKVRTSIKTLTNSRDSSGVLNLFYWTLRAETHVLELLAEESTIFCGFTTILPTFVNKEQFVLGDTVWIATSSELTLYNSILYFSNIKCVNEDSGAEIHPHIRQIGPIHVLQYYPHEKGMYKVEGDVLLGEVPDFAFSMKISNYFRVQ